jgi:hypothetical protein
VHANDPLARGLAKLSGIEAQPLPGAFEALDAKAAGNTLVILDDLTPALRRGDIDGWIAAAKSLDKRWIAPASKAARSAGGARVVITGESAVVVATLSPRLRLRLPKRSRLADHA